MTLFSVLLLLASANPATGGTAVGATEAPPKEERKICQRINASESRMASKRICKTAKQWKAEQNGSEGAGTSRARARSAD